MSDDLQNKLIKMRQCVCGWLVLGLSEARFKNLANRVDGILLCNDAARHRSESAREARTGNRRLERCIIKNCASKTYNSRLVCARHYKWLPRSIKWLLHKAEKDQRNQLIVNTARISRTVNGYISARNRGIECSLSEHLRLEKQLTK